MDTKAAIRKLKRMNPARIYLWGINIYTQAYRDGYEDGLKDAEDEFSNAIVIDEDEARERFGVDAVNRLLEDA